MPPNSRAEALLEREVLRTVGRTPGLLVCKNEVGVGYTGSVRPLLETTLKPWPEAAQRAIEVLQRSRITYGLGVGSPDLVLDLRGLGAAWELKTETGRLSSEQEQWHAAARKRGLHVEVIRSLDDARADLARLDAMADRLGLPRY